jgi:ABC-type glycerol-3-phosphate transport system substrate-binding protein
MDWVTNIGYPGYENPAIDETYNAGLIPAMFANAATGKMTPEEALTQADQEIRRIYRKWQDAGKI